MRLILTLTASLLAGTAVAQTGTFGSSTGNGGSAGGGVLSSDPIAGANESAGLPGTDASPDADVDARLGATGAATGPITDITELPPGAGDAGLDAGQDLGLDVGVDDGLGAGLDGVADDGLNTMDDALSDTDTGLSAPGNGADAGVQDWGPPVVEADGPVVVVPADGNDEDEPTEAAAGDPATRLNEGVGGDVQPKRMEIGNELEGAAR